MILLAMALQGSFPAKAPDTLRHRYGKPLSETFLVRPGIVVSASYGTSGKTCELAIVPKESDAIFTAPGSATIDDKLLQEIGDELVPKSDRGKYIMGTFLDISCSPEDDCAGALEDWEKVQIYRNAGKTGTRYEAIQWNREECGPKMGIHLQSDPLTPSH
jgi:hypothetical protein